jgi:DNA modification methylase
VKPEDRIILHPGDCLEVLKTLKADSIDSCCTDPPYGLGFMGKAWDHGVPGRPYWDEVLRVLKPGAHLLSFGGTRTFHRMTCAIEDAGFEIRDTIMWLYGCLDERTQVVTPGRSRIML